LPDLPRHSELICDNIQLAEAGFFPALVIFKEETAISTQNGLISVIQAHGIAVPKMLQALYTGRLSTELRQRDGVISPSSVGGCETFAVRQLRGEPKNHAGSPWSLLPDTGTFIHGYLQDVAELSGLLDPRNRELVVTHDDLKICGSVDGVLKLDCPDRFVHYEIKSVANKDLDRVKKTGRPLEKNKPQATTYQLCLGLNETLFHYVGREYCSEPTEILYKQEPEMVKFVVDWCRRVILAAEKADYSVNVWGSAPCNYCRYSDQCRKTFGG
jgi:hypothetical protein